jgi:iron(III) transport system permease protein
MAVNAPTRRFDPVWPAAFAALICAAPLLAVAALAVFGPWTDYMVHLVQTRLPAYLGHTALVTIIAAGLAGVIGAPLAWLVARYAFPGRGVFEWLVALPLAMPAYAAAYAWYDLTQGFGPLGGYVPTVRGPVGAGIIFAVTLYPYVYLLAREAFAGQSADAYDAARTLGESPRGAFLRAALPLARPAIAAGLALVVMESLADYGAVVHLGAPTLSVGLIRAWAGEGATADAARLAMILVAIAFVLFAVERSQRRRARQSAPSGKRRPPRRVKLAAPAAALAIVACSIPVLLGLVIPMGRLGARALSAPLASDLLEAAGNSLFLACLSGLVAAALGLAAAYALRSGRKPAVFAARLAGLGYAVPGSVAALGVLGLFGLAQSWLDTGWTFAFGGVFPALLTGSVFALVFAYQSRFAAAAISPAESALARVTPTLDAASRTLGAGPGETAWRVHRPLISSGALLAALLVFVEVLKELPATMILRPFNFETLAVAAHNYASDERLGEAAAPALLIVLIALPPMIWIARRITGATRGREITR